MRNRLPLHALFALTSLCVLAVNCFSQEDIANKKTAPTKDLFDSKRDAEKDISHAIELASKENKRILLHVGGNWCPWCKKLDNLFTNDHDISRLLKEEYIVVNVNFSSDNPNKLVLSKYPRVTGYPHLFILDKTGKLLRSQSTEELEDIGKYDNRKVLACLKK